MLWQFLMDKRKKSVDSVKEVFDEESIFYKRFAFVIGNTDLVLRKGFSEQHHAKKRRCLKIA